MQNTHMHKHMQPTVSTSPPEYADKNIDFPVEKIARNDASPKQILL